jgi:hypothetical protein
MALKAATKAKLLGLVRAGHDIESACASLNLSPSVVRKDEKLMIEVGEAFKIGTAKLRARLFQSALDNNDTRILGQMLERREAEQAAMAASETKRMDLSALSCEQLRILEAAALLLEDPAKILSNLSSYPGAAIEMTVAMLRGEAPPVPMTWAQVVEQMQRELLDELTRHAAAAERESATRNICAERVDQAEVLDETIPLPSRKAPAVRPARPQQIEVLPPSPSRYSGAYEPAPRVQQDRWSGTPWDQSWR